MAAVYRGGQERHEWGWGTTGSHATGEGPRQRRFVLELRMEVALMEVALGPVLQAGLGGADWMGRAGKQTLGGLPRRLGSMLGDVVIH